MAATSKTFEERVREARTKAEMTEYVQKVYAATERWIEPMPPFILIRTLPRSTISAGGILMPEKQNKPNIEAVVLAVYKPYWEKVESRTRDDGRTEDISVWNECDIRVGDHVILPHHCGLPDSFLDEKEYRLIREDDAIATLHYREKGELRNEIIQTAITAEIGAAPFTKIVDTLLEHYDIIPKVIYSRTLSGV